MEITTNGIILSKIKYGENAIICNVYTLEQGKQTYFISNSILKKNKAIYLHPLQILEFEINQNNNSKLQKVKSSSQAYVYKNIPFNVYKSSITVFISQLLDKLLHTESSNSNLFEFIKQSIIFIDNTEDSIANFHLFFMINLSKFLGYFPCNNYSDKHCYFDLKQAQFIDSINKYTSGPNVSKAISQIINTKVSDINSLKLDHSSRNIILDTLIYYFELHNDRKLDLKSLNVIRELFSC